MSRRLAGDPANRLRNCLSGRCGPVISMVPAADSRVREYLRSCGGAGTRLVADPASACSMNRGFGHCDNRPAIPCQAFSDVAHSAGLSDSSSRRQLPIQRSAIPFCHGLRTLVRIVLMPLAFRNSITSLPNLESRPNTTYRWGQGSGNASRSCCTIHSLVGCVVTFKWRMRPRPRSITKEQ